jgi:hypothetical protein
MNSPKFSQDPAQSFAGNESGSSMAKTAREAAAKIAPAAAETAARVKESAEKIATDQKENAADRVAAYGSAIHESASSLEQQDPNIAWLTHRAADRLESIASYVRTRDFRGLRDDAEDLARRHPVAFFGGMCVAGFVLGSVIRATRSSSTESQTEDESSDYPNYAGEESGPSFEDRPTQASAAAGEI